ncbi:phenylalanine--tRNA ligase subunit beta [Pseudaquidulcibacter saccharophilus]|uniref:phenylalanine--tRNA ligase subunit beta n=1 Tax=Pseudaquidulcibacter saccharophilus TaxID=2831900 RepID=UPI001EFF2BFA|nr:phenylalanine--tRNA ligase subunit beta [Pseudaquidulcibacter saccharophilus]
MKFTINWLKDYLQTDASADEIVAAMTMAGLEVEDVENPAEKLKAFSVVKIVEAVQHPNADKLRVCQVETNQGRLEIVCGAPNARAGLTTIFAPIGTCVEALGVTLEARPVRGVVSNGMMCSYEELGLTGDSSGIIELPDDVAVGTSAAAALGIDDVTIDFEVTPNRPDWLGVNSIARELAARGLGKFSDRDIKETQGTFKSDIAVKSETTACPLFYGRLIKGVKNGPSPKWLQDRLKAIGLRPINALVDITNFISIDRARPLHVYDVAKLKGNIVARAGNDGESFVALDDKTYNVGAQMCVIADDSGVIGLGGVMGGVTTGCDENTTDVFVESAYFEPLSIFQTGRATGIQSDAKYRFERGVDPAFTKGGLDFATQMIVELCGGLASEIVKAGEVPAAPKAIDFNVSEVKRLTGIELGAGEIIKILDTLGFVSKDLGDGKLNILPPTWRGDVKLPADIVEDVARIHGFDKLPMATLSQPQNRNLISSDKIAFNLGRRALASFGYNEVVTWSFVKKDYAKLFGANLENKALEIANPINDELEYMRPSALINLIAAAQRNIDKGFKQLAIFEAGPIYLGDEPNDQKNVIAAIATGETRHWNGIIKPDVYSIQADMMALLAAMGVPTGGLMMANGASSHFHTGRAGQLKMGPKVVVAEFGQIHPRIAKALGVDQDIFAFEIFVDALPKAKQKPSKAKPKLELSQFMPFTRDYAFILDKDKAVSDLVRAITNADKTLISNVNVFDVYSGKGVEDGKVSIAIEVTIAPKANTLNDAEIDALNQKIITAAGKQNASLRV